MTDQRTIRASASFGAIVAALALILVDPAPAEAQKTRVRTIRKIIKQTKNAPLRPVEAPSWNKKVNFRDLDWIHHTDPQKQYAVKIEERRVGDVIIRKTVTDGPIDPNRPSSVPGGRFRRKVLVERIHAPHGKRSWSPKDRPHLANKTIQGVRYDRSNRRVTLRLFQPEAKRIRLAIEGEKKHWDLKPDASGTWYLKLGVNPQKLYGKEYHYLVEYENGTKARIADPFADFAAHDGNRRISRFVNLEHKWRDQNFKAPKLEDLVIYETHLPSLSRHKSSGVASKYRGTYRGAMSRRVVNHFKKLGVAVEFLPLHAFDHLLGGDWGYSTTSFRAFEESYAPYDPYRANREVKALIDKYHRSGIPVLLDVVYNHNGELVVNAFGQEITHRKLPNGAVDEGSGVGASLRSETPVMRKMIVDTVKDMVRHYHVDGFRFDLGALLDEKTLHVINRSVPHDIYLISEPWSWSNAKWGKNDMKTKFKNTRWAIWNDDFREPVKDFLNGRMKSPKERDRLQAAVAGNPGWAARPQQMINYFASHDGHSSADAVGGDKRRVFSGVALTLFSQGIPMIAEGTEFMHSKKGEDNTWNNKALNQLDWSSANEHGDLVDSVAGMIALRKMLPHFKYKEPLREGRDISWIRIFGFPHADNVNTLGFVVRPPPGKKAPAGFGEVLVMANGGHGHARFYVPPGRPWKVIADGESFKVDAKGLPGRVVKDGDYNLPPGATVVLARDP